MKFFKRLAGFAFTALFFAGLYFICDYLGANAKSFYMDTPGKTVTGSIDFSKTSVDRLVENYVNNELERDIVLTAAGDMKFYEWQLRRAYDEAAQAFDFLPSFEYITKYVETGDYAVGDIETTLAGANNGTDTQYYGYGADKKAKLFNTPEIVAKNLKDAGFDMITTANEHALDSGAAGLTNTLDELTAAGLTAVGTRKSAEDVLYTIESVKGLNIGFIAYTNIMTNTEDEEALSLVNHLDNYDEAKITKMCGQIREMRAKGAEAVVVMLHFGAEYASAPDDAASQLAHQLIDAGADVILGSHTHVPGTIEVVNAKNSDGTYRKGLVLYSLGNFLTSQQYVDGSGQNRDMGMLCDIIFKKGKDGVRVGGINITPVYSNWTDTAVATVPVTEAYDNPEAFGDIFDDIAKSRIKNAYENIFPELMQNSGLIYTDEDYKYKISIEK